MSRIPAAFAFLLIAALAAPEGVRAAVFINEVAWMGTSVSDTDEWIELYNDGAEEVALAGWTLRGAGTAPNITLSGNISGGGFYLLERTDDTTVPSVTADKIYTGALGNGEIPSHSAMEKGLQSIPLLEALTGRTLAAVTPASTHLSGKGLHG